MYKMSRERFVLAESKDVIKDWVRSKGLRIQRAGAPLAPRWNNFRINKDNNGNRLNVSNCSKPQVHNDHFLRLTGHLWSMLENQVIILKDSK